MNSLIEFYDAPDKPQRPFEADYPNDKSPNTMDDPAVLAAIAREQMTGPDIRIVTRHYAGAFIAIPGAEQEIEMQIADDLTSDDANRVRA